MARRPRRHQRGVTDDDVPVALIRLGHQAMALEVNNEWSALTGLDRYASLGSGWLDALVLEHRDPAASLVNRLLADGGTAETEWQLARGGQGRWAAASVVAPRPAGSQTCTAALHDVTERRAREADLAQRANHDPLTGLANRDVLSDRAEHAMARLARRPGICAVLFIDLDHFKTINDTFGHHQGDMTLTAVARRLSNAMRSADTLARVGGDEFVVLCEDLNTPEEAISVANRLLAATRHPIDVQGGAPMLTASIGVAFAYDADTSIPQLLHRADRAMYQVKGRGGDGCEIDGSEVSRFAAPTPISSADGTDDLTTALTHLSLAAEALDQWAAADHDRGDGTRWMATDEARYGVHRSLIALREAADSTAPLSRPSVTTTEMDP